MWDFLELTRFSVWLPCSKVTLETICWSLCSLVDIYRSGCWLLPMYLPPLICQSTVFFPVVGSCFSCLAKTFRWYLVATFPIYQLWMRKSKLHRAFNLLPYTSKKTHQIFILERLLPLTLGYLSFKNWLQKWSSISLGAHQLISYFSLSEEQLISWGFQKLPKPRCPVPSVIPIEDLFFLKR